MNKFVKTLCIIFFINLTLFSSTLAETEKTEDECKKLENKSAHLRLNKYLFCEYEGWPLSTLNRENGTQVSLGMGPKKASFDEETGNLEIFGWMFISWDDPHLSWEPTSFEDIRWLRVHSYQIWEPEIGVLSGGNEDSNVLGLPYTHCYLSRRGMIICTPQMKHTVRCETDFTQWPFDRQNCNLVFSTWSRTSDHIKFVEKVNETIIMDFFQSNGEWTLTATSVVYDQRESLFKKSEKKNTSPTLSINFILDRVHNQLRGRYVAPAIIMMIMTLTTLWLDPKSTERLAVACLNIVIHLFCMQTLHWVLPHNGSTVPSLLQFYASSFVFATIALILTFLLGNLQEIKIEPPKWISSGTATILRSNVGQILLLSMLDPKVAAEIEPDADDAGDLVSSKAKNTAWGYVAIMCGWISFLSLFLAYVITYAVFVPNSSMRPPVKNIGILHLWA